MNRKPPQKPSNLEIDRSGHDEFRERQTAVAQEKSMRAASLVHKRVENQNQMKEAVRQAAERDHYWYQMRWRALKALFLLLVSYFLASAFFDIVNFIAGVKILWNWFQQIMVWVAIYAALNYARFKLSDERKDELARSGKSLGRPLYFIALAYLGIRGTWAISSTLVFRSKMGLRLNKPFFYFLCTLAVELSICWWLAHQRKRAMALVREIDSCMDADDLPAISRDQLYLLQFVAEGLILNLLLFAAFHFTYGVNVPIAMAWALLHSPLVFLFGFFPCLAYVFFRNHIQSYST